MALIETERLLKKIKNEYERAEVARWVNAKKPISITWSDKTARKTKLDQVERGSKKRTGEKEWQSTLS